MVEAASVRREVAGSDRDHSSSQARWPAFGPIGDTTDDDGFDLQMADRGTILSVYTRNTHYRLTVLNGAGGSVVVQGGRHFPEPTYARLQGSSGAGSGVKVGWIGVGLRMEVADGDRFIVTSPVQAIVIEDVPEIQREFWRIA
ncbi:MAG TPA: hypothetical protein VD833_22670 [Vicinamibacterales bacterium]|nr:hypothetical protein [Vicinamibacterales bacterium]